MLVTPFFDPSRCPICLAGLPPQPLRCPVCGVDLTGPTVTELVTTLRRADSLVMRMRADMAADMAAAVAPQRQAPVTAPAGAPVIAPPVVPPQVLADVTPTRSWFAGTSVGVILLILGALCVLAAGAVFIAVEWMLLPLVVRALILIAITAGFGFFAALALRRGLQATAEAMAIIACGMFVLDLAAARRAGLPGLADLATAPYEILAGVLLAAAASAAAFTVRSQTRWLWSLDAAVAVGMARAAFGALRLSSDEHAVSCVAVAVAVAGVASLLYVACRRVRLPIAMWSALGLGGAAWLAAVAAGAERAADYIGGDVGRVAASWPALTVAFLAGLWSIRLTHAVWRRGAAGLCLMPVLLIFEIVGWSHGWVVGCSVMLVGYVVAALTSDRVTGTWMSPVAGSALVLGLSAVFGLLPTAVELAARMGLALEGTWRAPRGLPFDLAPGDVGPWLVPLTALVVLAMLPQIRIDGDRFSLDHRLTAGVFLATLGVLPMLYGAGFWLSMMVLVIVAAILLGAARQWRNDYLLLLAWAPLVIIRICSYYVDPVYDDLADPLAVDAVCGGLPRLGVVGATPDGQGWVPHGRRSLRSGRGGAVAGLRAGTPIDPRVGDRGHRVARAAWVTEAFCVAATERDDLRPGDRRGTVGDLGVGRAGHGWQLGVARSPGADCRWRRGGHHGIPVRRPAWCRLGQRGAAHRGLMDPLGGQQRRGR